jgi:hypothetical protein
MATQPIESNRELLRLKINALPWHHQIDFGGGLLTPGNGTIDVMLAQADAYFRDGIAGQSFLDIGCWDGFNSLEAHKRVRAACLPPTTSRGRTNAGGSGRHSSWSGATSRHPLRSWTLTCRT